MAIVLPNVPNMLLIQFKGVNQSAPWLVGLHWHYNASTLLTGDINSLCASAAAAWNTHISPVLNTQCVLQRVQGTDLRSRDAAIGGVDVNHLGTKSGVTMPVQVAAVVSWKANYRWRGGHFRSYLPAGTSGDFATGKNWSTVFLTSLNTAADGFFGALNGMQVGGTGGHLSGVRYFDQGQLLTTPLDLPITDATVHSRIDTQRRRLGREAA